MEINRGAFTGSAEIEVEPGTTNLRLEMAEIRSIGNSEFYFQFRLMDPTGAHLAHPYFSAGVDAATRAIYDFTTAFFTGSD